MSKISRMSVVWLGVLLAAGYFNVHAARLQEAAAPKRTAPAAATADTSAAAQRALLDQYCVTCHNQRAKTAGLTLDALDIEHLGQAPETWEKVAHMLRTGAMPPTGRPRPDGAAASRLASFLEDGLDEVAAAAPNVGKIPPHRLNRTEYANAVRDLLGLDIPPTLLPVDNSILGFDNIAGALTVSPLLLERYMSVARQVSRLAVGDTTMMVAPSTYPIDSSMKQTDRENEDLPFGSRGFTIKHTFPLDGEYVIQLRLKRTQNEYIRGLGRRPQPIEVRVDGERIKLFPEAGLMKGVPPVEGFTQSDLGTPDWEKNSLDGDNDLQVRFPAKAGTRVISFAIPARRWNPDESFVLPPRAGREEERDGNIAIKQVEIAGPFDGKSPVDSASRQKIFTCQPAGAADQESCATTILTSIARKAYRRPLAKGDVQALMQFCRAGLERGFDGCIQSGLERILASPYFLFRVEGDASAADQPEPAPKKVGQLGGGFAIRNASFSLNGSPAADKTSGPAPIGPSRLNDLDLASRLSFFLWSSIPDDQLLDLAANGRLHEPATIAQQVKRMLADPRSRALVDNFADQWLELRRLDAATPVENIFTEFDGELRTAMREETERFIDNMFREDRPVPEMLSANYSFINERLARHYYIPNIVGSRFRKVTMPPERAGLMGQGSILLVTSQANRTSPVLRGKFVLDNILGSPVPPPPANVPPLKPENDQGLPLSIREALEKHRASPVCANCHARMDPWGFALENFDGVGAYRWDDGGYEIDTASTLLDGTKLEGPAGVRKLLMARSDQFISTVTEKLMVYALGRPVEYFDRPALRKVTKEAAAHENRWSSIILGVVNSMPFQYEMKGAE